jgi:hypothetical protein
LLTVALPFERIICAFKARAFVGAGINLRKAVLQLGTVEVIEADAVYINSSTFDSEVSIQVEFFYIGGQIIQVEDEISVLLEADLVLKY